MAYEDVILKKENGIATLILNRPQKLNALGPKILDEMADAIEKADRDDGVKVLVITGEGRSFCSGADLTGPTSGTDASVPELPRGVRIEPFARFGRVISLLRQTRKPTIAAINGIAAGAGISLTAVCDIRVASEKATFSAIFVRRGLVTDCGGTYLLPRIMGTDKALEMMWTGDFIDAAEAFRLRLVTKVVPHDDLMKEALALAGRIAKGPSIAIEAMKRMVYRGLEANNFDAQIAWEAFAQNVCHQTEDAKEGVRSFIEKREARFQGR